MKLFHHSSDIQVYIKELKQQGKTIGFVPTMGALHKGHVSLVHEAKNQCDIVVCSIFINPTQFNKKSDFVNYPIDIGNDTKMLENSGCDIVFIPKATEIYPDSETVASYSFPAIDSMMEGEHRPGHFTGVAQVVKRFFDIVTPNFAYFGLKDYQQYLVIKTLAEKEHIDTEIIGCPTIRETDGLAMSSRNRLLSEKERATASVIFQVMNRVKKSLLTTDLSLLKEQSFQALKEAGLEPEYFEIADADTLLPIVEVKEHKKVRAFVAANLGKARLIDNMELI